MRNHMSLTFEKGLPDAASRRVGGRQIFKPVVNSGQIHQDAICQATYTGQYNTPFATV